MQHSGVSLASAVLGALVSFLVGYTAAVISRARADHKGALAVAEGRRQEFWAGVRQMLKLSIFAAVVAIALVSWVVRDLQDGRKNTPLLPSRPPTAVPAKR